MKRRDEEILFHIHQSLAADLSCGGLGPAETDVGRVYSHVQMLGVRGCSLGKNETHSPHRQEHHFQNA